MSEHTITLCIPHSLLERLNKRSMAEGITLNEICLQGLQSQTDEADEDALHDGPPVLRPGDTP